MPPRAPEEGPEAQGVVGKEFKDNRITKEMLDIGV